MLLTSICALLSVAVAGSGVTALPNGVFASATNHFGAAVAVAQTSSQTTSMTAMRTSTNVIGAGDGSSTMLTFCNVIPPRYGQVVTLTIGTDAPSPAVSYGSCTRFTVSAASAQATSIRYTVDGTKYIAPAFGGFLCPSASSALSTVVTYYDDVRTMIPQVRASIDTATPCSVEANKYRLMFMNFMNGMGSANLVFTMTQGDQMITLGNASGYGLDSGIVGDTEFSDQKDGAFRFQARLSTDNTTVLVDDPASLFNEHEKSILPGQAVLVMIAGIRGDTLNPPRVFYSPSLGNGVVGPLASSAGVALLGMILAIVSVTMVN